MKNENARIIIKRIHDVYKVKYGSVYERYIFDLACAIEEFLSGWDDFATGMSGKLRNALYENSEIGEPVDLSELRHCAAEVTKQARRDLYDF